MSHPLPLPLLVKVMLARRSKLATPGHQGVQWAALEKVHFSFSGQNCDATAKRLLLLLITRARPPAEAAETLSEGVDGKPQKGEIGWTGNACSSILRVGGSFAVIQAASKTKCRVIKSTRKDQEAGGKSDFDSNL